MSSFLLFTSVHLGIELLGSTVFFIVAWIFLEAYLLKRDVWSAGRALGFILLSVSELLHSVVGSSESALYAYITIAALLLLFASYAFEKLPPRPPNGARLAQHQKEGGPQTKGLRIVLASPSLVILGQLSFIAPVLFLGITAALLKRYFKDIDKLLKWLAISFVFLALASILSEWGGGAANIDRLWIAEHVLRFLGFAAVGVWVWQWLSLRLREELLIVFVGASLCIALLVTTVFSFVLAQRILVETENKLQASAQILTFYIDGLKSKALAGAQIIARDDDFASAVKFKDAGDMERIGRDLLSKTGGEFLTVAGKNGNVFFKLNFPNAEKENILAEWIGAEALEGRPSATVEESANEGFSVRAAAPIFFRGEIVGAVVTGALLNNRFADEFKKISKLETTIFSGGKISGSTFFDQRRALEETLPEQEFVGGAKVLSQEIIGAFMPIKNFQNQIVGTIAVTATPEEVLLSSQRIGRLTLFIVLIIVLALIIPLYRLTILLTA